MGKKVKGNGEGTLYFSEALQKWVAQYVEPSGKRKTLTQKKNEKVGDFKKRFNKIISDINQGSYISTTNETLYSILKNYIDQKYLDGITSPRSHKRELETLAQIEKTCNIFINKSIQKITVSDIENSKKFMRVYSNNTISKIWMLLNKGFSLAVSRRKIVWNIMNDEALLKPISLKEHKHIEALSIKEEKMLIEKLKISPNKQYNDIILLQLYTGARIGEILALSKDCVDLKQNTLTIYRTITRDENDKAVLGKHTKTYNKKTGIDTGRRTFPMSPKVQKIIEQYTKNRKIENVEQLLFWNSKNNSLVTDAEINCYLDRINQNKCITDNLHSHRLRHTFVTRCEERGAPLAVIQALVGHVQGSKITNNTYMTVSFDLIKQELEKIL